MAKSSAVLHPASGLDPTIYQIIHELHESTRMFEKATRPQFRIFFLRSWIACLLCGDPQGFGFKISAPFFESKIHPSANVFRATAAQRSRRTLEPFVRFAALRESIPLRTSETTG